MWFFDIFYGFFGWSFKPVVAKEMITHHSINLGALPGPCNWMQFEPVRCYDVSWLFYGLRFQLPSSQFVFLNPRVHSITEAFEPTRLFPGPMYTVNVEQCSGEFRQLANQFTAQLACGELSELSQIGLKIMKATCNGQLLNHPCILGIVLQCIDTLDRESRGVNSLKRPRNMGDREQALVQESGLMLASNGCSTQLMRSLGFSKLSCLKNHSTLDMLQTQGLPNPALALLDSTVMADNIALISQLLPKRPALTQSQRMVLCFDFTYLCPLHCPGTLHHKKGLLGGPFRMEDIGSDRAGSFQLLEANEPLFEKQKANRMILGWILLISLVCF